MQPPDAPGRLHLLYGCFFGKAHPSLCANPESRCVHRDPQCVPCCFVYSSSDTGSHHSFRQFSPGTSMAIWLNRLSFFAPCQCLTLAGSIITLPRCRLTAALPSARYQPSPAVQSQSCPPPFEAQLVCRLFKGHIGGKKNTASRDGEAVQTGFPRASRCRFPSLRTRLAV